MIFLAPCAASATVPVILAFIARPTAGEEGCCPPAYCFNEAPNFLAPVLAFCPGDGGFSDGALCIPVLRKS